MSTRPGVHLKMKRATELAALLRSEAKAQDATFSSDLVVEQRSAAETVVRVTNPPDIPADFGLVLGDCLHNYRSALDHLAAYLVLNSGRQGTKVTKSTAFPIFNDQQSWKSVHASRTKGMSPADVRVIAGLQPYVTHPPPAIGWLWALSELDNLDKHELLHVVSTAVTEWGQRVSFPEDDPSTLYDLEIHWTPLTTNDGVILTVRPQTPVRSIRVDVTDLRLAYVVAATSRTPQFFLPDLLAGVEAVVRNAVSLLDP